MLADRRGLSKYGEIVNLDAADADRLIAAHPPALLLPADLWNEIFVPGPETDAELARFPSVAIHYTASEAFREKTRGRARRLARIPRRPAGRIKEAGGKVEARAAGACRRAGRRG